MKAYRVEYFVPMIGYPGGGFRRSKKVMANNAEQAKSVVLASIKSKGSSIQVLRSYEDNCKNCRKNKP